MQYRLVYLKKFCIEKYYSMRKIRNSCYLQYIHIYRARFVLEMSLSVRRVSNKQNLLRQLNRELIFSVFNLLMAIFKWPLVYVLVIQVCQKLLLVIFQ